MSWLCSSWFWPSGSTSTPALEFIRHPCKPVQFTDLAEKKISTSPFFFLLTSVFCEANEHSWRGAEPVQDKQQEEEAVGWGKGRTPSQVGNTLELLLSLLQLIIIVYHYFNHFYIALLGLLEKKRLFRTREKKGQCFLQILMKEHCESLNQAPVNSPT